MDDMKYLTEKQISERLFIWSGKIKLLGSLDSDILEIILNFLVADACTSWIYGMVLKTGSNLIRYLTIENEIVNVTYVCKKSDINPKYYNIGRVIRYIDGLDFIPFPKFIPNTNFQELELEIKNQQHLDQYSKSIHYFENNSLYNIWKNMSEIETNKKQYNNLKKQQKNYLKNQQQKIRYQFKLHHKGNKKR